MSDRRLGDTFWLDFATHDPSTGMMGTPSAGPTVSIYEDGTDAPILTPSPAVRNSKTGLYKVAVAATAGNGFEFGKSYNAHVEYEFPGDMGAIPQAQIIERFTLDSRLTGDLNNITAADVWAVVARTLTSNGNDISIADVQTALTNQGVTAARAGYLDRLDAVLSTRAAEATAVAGFAAGAKDATCAKEVSLAPLAHLDGDISDVPAAVDAALSATHGAGSWEGGGSAPTVGQIDNQLSGTHGAGQWVDPTAADVSNTVLKLKRELEKQTKLLKAIKR